MFDFKHSLQFIFLLANVMWQAVYITFNRSIFSEENSTFELPTNFLYEWIYNGINFVMIFVVQFRKPSVWLLLTWEA